MRQYEMAAKQSYKLVEQQARINLSHKPTCRKEIEKTKYISSFSEIYMRKEAELLLRRNITRRREAKRSE
jgi:hypothetical protein